MGIGKAIVYTIVIVAILGALSLVVFGSGFSSHESANSETSNGASSGCGKFACGSLDGSGGGSSTNGSGGSHGSGDGSKGSDSGSGSGKGSKGSGGGS